MYHQVTAGGPPGYAQYTVTPAAFARQMRVLVGLGYRAITLDDVVAARSAGSPLPRRSVVITFDDGFADAVRHAVPVLVRRGLTATFFVVTGLVGRMSEWTRRNRGIEMALAGAPMLREISDAGFTVGSHAVTHRPLAELEESESRYELRHSRRRLEDLLGREVRHLAYPFGSANDVVRAAAAECGYRTACSTIAGLSPDDEDLLMLRRIHVAGSDSIADFVSRLRTGRSLSTSVRGLLRSSRKFQRTRVTRKVSDFAR